MSEKHKFNRAKITQIAALLVIGLALAGCTTYSTQPTPSPTVFATTPGAATTNDSGGIKAVGSFYPMYFFASQIIGQKGTATNLVPPGVEPHDFELTPQAIGQLQDANVIAYNGLGLEKWIESAHETLQLKAELVDASAGITPHAAVDPEDPHEVNDPHVWQDPQLAKVEAANIAEAIERADPSQKPYYDAQLSSLDAKLDALDADYKTGLAHCQRKDIITSHAAFGYMAQRYGLNQVPISGLSPEAEPSAAELAQIAQFARDHNVTYIFFESLVNPQLSKTIASEVGAKTLVLDPLEGVSAQRQAQGADYFTVMRENLQNLRTALSCT